MAAELLLSFCDLLIRSVRPLQVGLLTAVPKSSGGRHGCAVQPGSRLLEQEDRPDDARGQFLVVCDDVCANGGDVVLLSGGARRTCVFIGPVGGTAI